MLKQTKNSAGALRWPTLLALTTTLSLMGCATLGSGTRYIDTSCDAMRPITYSSRDTPETKAEIKAHNRAYDALCPPK